VLHLYLAHSFCAIFSSYRAEVTLFLLNGVLGGKYMGNTIVFLM